MLKQATKWRELLAAGKLSPKAEVSLTKSRALTPAYEFGRAYKRSPTLADYASQEHPFGQDFGAQWLKERKLSPEQLDSAVRRAFTPEQLGWKRTEALPTRLLGEGVESAVFKTPGGRALKLTQPANATPDELESFKTMPMDLTARLTQPKEIMPGIYATLEQAAKPGGDYPAGNVSYSRAITLLRKLRQSGRVPRDIGINRLDQLGALPSGELRLLDPGAVALAGTPERELAIKKDVPLDWLPMLLAKRPELARGLVRTVSRSKNPQLINDTINQALNRMSRTGEYYTPERLERIRVAMAV